MTDYTDLCPSCGAAMPEGADHCPNCLCSVHGEDQYGFDCGGTLESVSLWVRSDREWQLIQRCRVCGALELKRAVDEDSPVALLSLAAAPLASPPFPLEKMNELFDRMGGQGGMEGYWQ